MWSGLWSWLAVFVAIGLLRLPLPAVLLLAIPAQHRHHLRDAAEGPRHEFRHAIRFLTLAWTFALMSLFAVGGANSAIPEMHRVAVDVQHWLTDKQFADVYAISQLSPGPNVLIVTLIGYSVAGVAGALVATLSMCVPTAVLAYVREPLSGAIEPVRAGPPSSRRRWFRFRSG